MTPLAAPPRRLSPLQTVVLVTASVELVHYVFLAWRGDPFNLGTLLSLAIAALGFAWVIASRAGVRLPPLRPRVRRALTMLAVALATGWLASVAWMFAGSSSDEAQPVDVVVVLGAGLKHGRATPTLERRIDAAARYLLTHPDLPVVACGGVSPGQNVSEAETIRNGLVARGISRDRILLEDRSTSTEENLRFARSLLSAPSSGARPRALITTSNFHLARAKLIARRAGFDPFGLPASTPWYNLPNSAARETLAIFKSTLIDSWR